MQGMTPAWGENLLELDPSEMGSGGATAAAYIDDRLVLDAWWGEKMCIRDRCVTGSGRRFQVQLCPAGSSCGTDA